MRVSIEKAPMTISKEMMHARPSVLFRSFVAVRN